MSEPSSVPPHRVWTILTLGVVFVVLGLVAGVVVVLDPFMHYHKPWFGYGMVSWKEAYTNPGVAKNLDFNAAVIGGSYVQNTKVSTVDRVFGVKAVKLTNAGGTPANLHRLLDLAFSSGQPLKTVLVAIPVTKFTSSNTDSLRSELPEYLYDDNPLNDVAYLWNREVVIPAAVTALNQVVGRGKNWSEERWLDEAYSWWGRYKTKNGKAYILKHYEPPSKASREYPAGHYRDAAKAQFEAHLAPVITAHPDTVFRFFFPPFSRLLWRDLLDRGSLRAHLEIKRYLTVRLLSYPNVEVHDFMRLEQYMSDLDNYKDRTHFLPPVTEYLTEALATGEHRLTTAETDADLDAFLAYVAAYDDPEIPRAQPGAEPDADNKPEVEADTVGQDLF